LMYKANKTKPITIQARIINSIIDKLNLQKRYLVKRKSKE
jgi:hypothetical protein